jgi:hypothetical protein
VGMMMGRSATVVAPSEDEILPHGVAAVRVRLPQPVRAKVIARHATVRRITSAFMEGGAGGSGAERVKPERTTSAE